jgi:hypothetical protein
LPIAEKLDPIPHVLSRPASNQAEQAPHLATNGISLLRREDNPGVVLAGVKEFTVQCAKVAHVESIKNPSVLLSPFEL